MNEMRRDQIDDRCYVGGLLIVERDVLSVFHLTVFHLYSSEHHYRSFLCIRLYLEACRLTVHYVFALLCTIEMTPKMTFTPLCTGCDAGSTAAYVRSRRFYISKRKLSRGA